VSTRILEDLPVYIWQLSQWRLGAEQRYRWIVFFSIFPYSYWNWSNEKYRIMFYLL